MTSYRIHRLKDHLRQSFRHAPHVSGTASVKPRDYLAGESVEAQTPYAAYFALRASPAPIEPGDLLESDSGELRIYKYIGFEQAQWVLPEPKQPPVSIEAAAIPATVE